MHASRFALVMMLGLFASACAAPRNSASPVATPTAEASPQPPEQASAPEPTEHATHESMQHDHAHAASAVDPDLNRRYDEENDPKRWEDRFEKEGREVFDRRADILAALALQPSWKVADVGAGTGLFTLPFARSVAHVYAVDVQQYFLDHISRKAAAAKLGNIELVKAEQNSPGLPPNAVDLAFLSDVYHHLEQPATYLAALRAALKPGGRLVIIDFERDADAPEWIRKHVRASPEVFRREIEAAGFRFVESKDLLQDNFLYVFEKP